MASVSVLDEVRLEPGSSGWQLCFQRARYNYEDGGSQEGFRFIYRDPDGNLRPQRGQARISSVNDILRLLGEAADKCWL